jgi:hypothetical protein
MNLSHAYAAPPPREYGVQLLNRALDVGYDFLDTAALYGLGANETLLAEALGARRDEYMLASKCGMLFIDGKRTISSRPRDIRQVCEDSLKRLKVEAIDLYYLHRWDKRLPIEESVGALADLVAEGKIRSIGLSEVSAATLRRAHAEYPVAAVQSEYSLWTRNPEIAVLDACRELGVAFVPFSPVGRGFLTSAPPDPASFVEKDIRRPMPRFQSENWRLNVTLLTAYHAIAEEADCTPAQLALAWLLAQGEDLIPIPGTMTIAHMEENFAAKDVSLSPDILQRLDALINENTVHGPRYPAHVQPEIDTEEFG